MAAPRREAERAPMRQSDAAPAKAGARPKDAAPAHAGAPHVWRRLGQAALRWSGLGWLAARIVRRNPKALRQSLTDALADHTGESDAGESDAAALPFTPKERKMLRNLLGFRDVRVRDVMVPRAEIVAAEEKESLAGLRARFTACAHSRLPLYRGSLDDPRGMVHIKDALKAMDRPDAKDLCARDFLREVLFVPPSMPAMDLLLTMQARRMHLALVIDEHGGTDGLVSIENLVEEIVGEIEDEHDDADMQLVETEGGILDVPARLPLKELEQRLNVSLRNGRDMESDSVGGLVVALAGEVPQRGEVVRHPSGIEFEVADADARRIKHLRIRPARGSCASAADSKSSAAS